MEAVLPKRRYIPARSIGAESMVRDAENKSYHFLNPTAAIVWECLDGATTVAECERRIREAFEVPAEADVAADIRKVLADFSERGLLAQ